MNLSDSILNLRWTSVDLTRLDFNQTLSPIKIVFKCPPWRKSECKFVNVIWDGQDVITNVTVAGIVKSWWESDTEKFAWNIVEGNDLLDSERHIFYGH